MSLFKDDFDRESERWTADVRARAAKLVRGGTPPLDALEVAKSQIQDERRAFRVAEMAREVAKPPQSKAY